MERTRLFWGEAAVGGLMLGLAGVTGQPLLMLGGGVLVAALVGRQYAFARAAIRVVERLEVDLATDRSLIRVDQPFFVTFDAHLPSPVPVDVDVEVRPPLPARKLHDGDATLHIPAGRQTAELSVPLQLPVAGTFTFDGTTVSIRERSGLFEVRVPLEPPLSITADAGNPRPFHLGADGQHDESVFAGASAGRIRQGIEPVGIRRYVPGDTLRRIDWNATARFNYPHIREFETESDAPLLMVIDHRSPLGTGPPGETAYDYLRTTALGVLAVARSRNELVSLVTVGDDGVSSIQPTRATDESYREIRRLLLAIDPESTGTSRWQASHGAQWSPGRAARASVRLDRDDSSFASRLRPFLESGATYVEGETRKPLFSAVRTSLDRLGSPGRVVVLTGDDDRVELRQTVDLLASRAEEVSLFVVPLAILGDPTTSDPHTARREYADFESFRRSLDGLAAVDARAVGPMGRFETIATGVDDRGRH